MPSATFSYTGGWQTWAVPHGVKSVQVELHGAAGTGGSHGSQVVGRLSVLDTQVLYLLVGEQGHAHNGGTGGAGGFGGGGPGGNGRSAAGGDGGGGYSAIRLNSTAGTVLAVAGGGAGDSGDSGQGGRGGGSTGASGAAGTSAAGAIGVATGGTQTQGGNGGTSSSGTLYDGLSAGNVALTSAGRGGTGGSHAGPGGGGGGGGFRSGGGGNAGATGFTPGGGGGGGSDYIDRLTSVVQSVASLGNGQIIFTWSTPSGAGALPNPPSIISPADGARLKVNTVTIKATLTDPAARKVRMKIYLSDNNFKTTFGTVYFSDWVDSGKVATWTRKFGPNVHQYAKVYTENTDGGVSLNYAKTNYYSSFAPDPPTLNLPADNVQISGLSSTVFTWTVHDADAGNHQAAAQIRWYKDQKGAAIHPRGISGDHRTYTADPLIFKSGTGYLWQVRTKNSLGNWSDWSDTNRFYVTGVSTPPRRLSPDNDTAVDVGIVNHFTWKFVDPNQGDQQHKADLRYRVIGTNDWITMLGNTTVPGVHQYWNVKIGTFSALFHYEWQVRTYDVMSGGLTPSDWSDSATFHAIASPSAGIGDVAPVTDQFSRALGCGHNRAFLGVKGGHIILGELTPLSQITWGRTRDDISKCNVSIPLDCDKNGRTCQLLSLARSWQHEIIVFRDSDDGQRRSWEGPITRIGYFSDHVEIEAQDVTVWTARRIMKQGYNDAYPNLLSVVKRGGQIIMNALAPDDPNVLKYLTLLEYPDDAKESRIRADWQSTAWDELDDLASNAGLDYTTVGRRIILFDTHRPVGRLPLLRNGDFTADPVITEYGMLYASLYGVTDNAGHFSFAGRNNSATGPVELLTSAYGSSAAAPGGTLTAKAKKKLLEALHAQAKRGLASRFPIPVQVRVPDNSGLAAHCPIPIEYLVPGMWLPVQAEHSCRTVAQWQKLDSVTVTESPDTGEQVQVTLSPAPNAGQDPDAQAAAEADSGN